MLYNIFEDVGEGKDESAQVVKTKNKFKKL